MMRRKLAALVWGLLIFVFAVSSSPVSLYDRVVPKLLEAKQVLDQDPAAALVLIEEAQRAFSEGRDALPSVIATGIEQALRDARVSVARKSKADLEGRIWVVRGAFGKVFYDAFFEAVVRGDFQQAELLLDRLIEASARPSALKRRAWRFIEKKDVDGLRRLFEAEFIKAILRSLDIAGEGDNRAHAYAMVSKAYGLFLIIQDSPRVRNIRAKDFIAALSALSTGKLSQYSEQVQSLKKKLAAALVSLEGLPTKAGVEAGNVGKEKAFKKESLTPRTQATDAPTYEDFVEDLAFLLDDHKKAETVALKLISAGVRSIDEWRDQLYIAEGYVATAQAYLSTGQPQRAQTYLDSARARFLFSLYPLVEAVDPGLAKDTDNFFKKLREGLGLRSSDVAVLAVALERVRSEVFDERVSPWFEAQIKVEKATFGLPRAVLFLIVGALSLFPVYLVWLTFGGRNIYWRLLGSALFFLFVPAIFEGLSYLGEILAYYGGLPGLFALSNLSIFQSVVMQLLWGFLIFVVVVLAGWGLRGLAQQFGLLPERRTTTAAVLEHTREDTQESAIVEWDEEF